MGSTSKNDECESNVRWMRSSIARVLLREKYPLSVLIALYQARAAGASEIIRLIDGHPRGVMRSIRKLEKMGAISRARFASKVSRGRPSLQCRLTLKGLQLVETSAYRWVKLIRKWERLP